MGPHGGESGLCGRRRIRPPLFPLLRGNRPCPTSTRAGGLVVSTASARRSRGPNHRKSHRERAVAGGCDQDDDRIASEARTTYMRKHSGLLGSVVYRASLMVRRDPAEMNLRPDHSSRIAADNSLVGTGRHHRRRLGVAVRPEAVCQSAMLPRRGTTGMQRPGDRCWRGGGWRSIPLCCPLNHPVLTPNCRGALVTIRDWVSPGAKRCSAEVFASTTLRGRRANRRTLCWIAPFMIVSESSDDPVPCEFDAHPCSWSSARPRTSSPVYEVASSSGALHDRGRPA